MSEPIAPDLAAPRAATEKKRRTPSDARLRQRERLYRLFREHPLAEVAQDEVDAHFQYVPLRYWERVKKAELVWGLETVHQFLRKRTSDSFGADSVVADWRPCGERGLTQVMVCAWDRPGLLTKVAAAFTALRVNILKADVYTRLDNLALDVFEVCDLESRSTSDSARLRHLVFLLEGALHDPPRFVSVWAGQFHKTLEWKVAAPFQIEFDNESSEEHTILQLEGSDRLGLLHDVLQTLVGCGVNVSQAVVDTQDEIARDRLYLTDFQGKKILSEERLNALRVALRRAVTPAIDP